MWRTWSLRTKVTTITMAVVLPVLGASALLTARLCRSASSW